VINGCQRAVRRGVRPWPGQHARSAVGVAELPLGAPVEVEAIFEVSG
jgi:enamine deaminase RidA (YjgF/YER057c/UK114 family)